MSGEKVTSVLDRRGLLGLATWAACGWPGGLLQAASAPLLPKAQSLPHSLERALKAREPLVVMVSLPGCGYCTVVREHHLVHLNAQGGHVVQIDMRDRAELTDFDGKSLTQEAWIRMRQIKVAPTVLFYGPGGKEVAKRLDGAYLPDFYAAYFDEQYQAARLALGVR